MANSSGMRKVFKVITSLSLLEGGGCPVRRAIGIPALPISESDPFIMLDQMGPITYAPGEAIGFPDHPHSGISVITYVKNGALAHKDTAGNAGRIGENEAQLMHAGSGLLHAEMPAEDFQKAGGMVQGFQMWYTLPCAIRMQPPVYYFHTSSDMPVYDDTNGGRVQVRVVAGSLAPPSGSRLQSKWGEKELKYPITYYDIELESGARYLHQLPAKETALVYCWRGSASVCGKPIEIGQLAVTKRGEGSEILLHADRDSSACLLLLQGPPHSDPVVQRGGLVATNQEELRAIMKRVYEGGFGSIEGEEDRLRQTYEAQARQEDRELRESKARAAALNGKK